MKLALLLIVPLFVGACAVVGPEYTPPTHAIEEAYHAPSGGYSADDTVSQWWKVFEDQQLNILIAAGLKTNPDLEAARASVVEARALILERRGGLFPQISSKQYAVHREYSENGAGPGPKLGDTEDVFSAAFDASWELDVFGGVRRRVEAAKARYGATEERARDMRLSLISEIARSYFTLRGAQRRLVLTEENIELQRETARLVGLQLDAGAASKLDLIRAQSRATRTEAQIPSLRADIRSSAFALSVLTGQAPEALLTDLLSVKPLPATPEIVPVGLRSEILRRRPDVRQAERELAASSADVGVAMADLFPRFHLTGQLSLESLTIGHLFEGNSVGWSLGPSLSWPIFQGGAIRARIHASEVRNQAAAELYESAVLNALRDVETALTRYSEELESRATLERAAAQMRNTVALARQRYAVGEDTLLGVVDAQREQAETDDLLAQSETRSLINLISLYKALGGGWEEIATSDGK